jgi:hypothetical protein
LNLHKYKVHKLILPELPFLHPILWRYYPNPLILLDLDHPKQIWHKKLYWNDLAHQTLLLLMPQLILLSIHHKLLQSYRNLQLQIKFHHNYNQLKVANWVHQILYGVVFPMLYANVIKLHLHWQKLLHF